MDRWKRILDHFEDRVVAADYDSKGPPSCVCSFVRDIDSHGAEQVHTAAAAPATPRRRTRSTASKSTSLSDSESETSPTSLLLKDMSPGTLHEIASPLLAEQNESQPHSELNEAGRIIFPTADISYCSKRNSIPLRVKAFIQHFGIEYKTTDGSVMRWTPDQVVEKFEDLYPVNKKRYCERTGEKIGDKPNDYSCKFLPKGESACSSCRIKMITRQVRAQYHTEARKLSGDGSSCGAFILIKSLGEKLFQNNEDYRNLRSLFDKLERKEITVTSCLKLLNICEQDTSNDWMEMQHGLQGVGDENLNDPKWSYLRSNLRFLACLLKSHAGKTQAEKYDKSCRLPNFWHPKAIFTREDGIKLNEFAMQYPFSREKWINNKNVERAAYDQLIEKSVNFLRSKHDNADRLMKEVWQELSEAQEIMIKVKKRESLKRGRESVQRGRKKMQK